MAASRRTYLSACTSLADADVLLVTRRAETTGEIDLDTFATMALADQLPAVQAGAVAEIGFDVWVSQSVGNVLLIADDIERFVLPHL